MAVPQTSEHGGFIRGLAAEMDSGGDAIDAAITRDGIVNNLLHLLDERGQVLVAFHAVAATDVQLTSPSTTTPSLIPGCNFPVTLSIRHGDASSYRVVIYMRAAISAAGTATFWLALRVPRTTLRPPDPASFSTTYVASVSTTSTSGADLAATLYVGSDDVAEARLESVPSIDGGEDPATALVLPASIQIWAKSSSGSSNPQVLAFVAREFAGER